MTATNLARTAPSLTSAAFQPKAGSLLIVTWSGVANGAAPTSVTLADTLGETIWTPMALFNPFNFSMCKVWYGFATTRTSRQVSVTVAGPVNSATANNAVVVDQIDCSAVIHTASVDTFSANPTASFIGTTPLPANLIYSCCVELGIGTLTPPPSQTTLVNTFQGSTVSSIASATRLAGSAPQANAWTVAGGGTPGQGDYASVRALELSPPPPPPPPTTYDVGHIPFH